MPQTNLFVLSKLLALTSVCVCVKLHFSQDAAILPGIVKKVSQTVASACAAWLLPRAGQWTGASLGFLISSIGLLVYGIGSLCCLGQVCSLRRHLLNWYNFSLLVGWGVLGLSSTFFRNRFVKPCAVSTRFVAGKTECAIE